MPRPAPPEQGRFRKGQSGNPNGRPKKQVQTQSSSAFDIVMDRTLTVTHAGVPREITVDEALEQRTYQAALAGDKTAQREMFRMILRNEKARSDRHPVKHNPITVVHEYADPRVADEALVLLGIADQDASRTDWPKPEDHLLLEPWAVKAALSRRSARRLTKKDLDEARRCTRDASGIAWPPPAEP